MESTNSTITVEATVKAPADKVWALWTLPEHITQWNSPSDDWHTPFAENDLKTGGKFTSRMEARDGSFGFDFGGVYEEVVTNKLIRYELGDGRKVKITFAPAADGIKITEVFEPETINSHDMQRAGWQAILDNFKKYAEAHQ